MRKNKTDLAFGCSPLAAVSIGVSAWRRHSFQFLILACRAVFTTPAWFIPRTLLKDGRVPRPGCRRRQGPDWLDGYCRHWPNRSRH